MLTDRSINVYFVTLYFSVGQFKRIVWYYDWEIDRLFMLSDRTYSILAAFGQYYGTV